MAFHPHDHRYCRNVAEDKNEICMKRKEEVSQRVVCGDANGETEQFVRERPEEGVAIDRLLGPGDDPDPNDVFEMRADVRAEVVVE